MTSDVGTQAALPISQMLWQTFEKWYDDDIPRHAAVLAFYALFAVAPILLFCVEVLGLVYGRDMAEAQVLTQVASFVDSSETAAWVNTFLHNILPSSANWWVTAGFVLALLYGASSFFTELKYVLNRIWDVPVPQDVNIGRFLLRRFQAVLMVLASSLLIFFGLLVTRWLSMAMEWATLYLKLGTGYESWIYLILVFVFLTLVFALIYKFVPDVDVEWKNVWIGAAATALLLSITRLLIGLYFDHSYTTTMFGAASALVIILLSVFYSTQIFFLGAEFTHVYSQIEGEDAVLPNDVAAEQVDSAPMPRTLPSRQSGPVKLDIINIESENPKPATVPIAQAEPEPKNISRFAKLRGRLPRLKFGKNKPFNPLETTEPNAGVMKTDGFLSSKTVEEPTIDLPNTDLPNTDLPNTDLPNADGPLSSETVEGPNADLPNADGPLSSETAEGPNADPPPSITRIKNIILLPIRILRPVRQVVVAVGVIFAISIAALSGIPFLRKRKRREGPAEEDQS